MMRYLSAHYIYPISSPPLKNGIICVNDDGCIVDVINTGGKLNEREKLEFYDGILVPGFVNAHCHLELSHLRGAIAQHIGLSGFISSIREQRVAPETTILAAAKAADSEMRRNGIVAVGDISNNAGTLPVKRDSPMRYRTFVEVFGLDDSRSEHIFTRAKHLKQEFQNEGLLASIVPHASYSVSKALWEMIHQSYMSSSPQVVSIHHRESNDESHVFWKNINVLTDMNYLLVHNTFSTKDELNKYLPTNGRFYFVLCPCSNLFIQNRLPDVQLFLSQEFSQKVCLGTDSLASNTHLSILEEMKTIRQQAPEISINILLQWATLNGARALGFDHLLGSFDKNKKPGVNLITGFDFEKRNLTCNAEVKMLVEN